MKLQSIMQVHPYFKANYLPWNSNYAYKGNLSNIEQDIATLSMQLNPKHYDMPYYISWKELGPGSNN